MLNKSKTVLKLGDFGISKKLKPNLKLTDRTGTPAYQAPEVHEKKAYDPI
jgi:serine/threonine protein kinase